MNREESRKYDLFKRILDVLTLSVLIVGLGFAWDQAVKLTEAQNSATRAQNLAAWTNIINHSVEMDRLFVEYPHLQRYFIWGHDIKENDQEYPRAYAISEMTLDHMDDVLKGLDMYHDKLDAKLLDKPAWLKYFKESLKDGPLLCRTFSKHPEVYGEELQAFAKVNCPCWGSTSSQHSRN